MLIKLETCSVEQCFCHIDTLYGRFNVLSLTLSIDSLPIPFYLSLRLLARHPRLSFLFPSTPSFSLSTTSYSSLFPFNPLPTLSLYFSTTGAPGPLLHPHAYQAIPPSPPFA